MNTSRHIIAYMSVLYGAGTLNCSYSEWISNTFQYQEQFAHFISRGILSSSDMITDSYSPTEAIQVSDKLVVDWVIGHSTKYTKLNSIIESASTNPDYKNSTLCIYDLSALGYTTEIIKKHYCALMDANIPLYIIDPETKNGISQYSTASTDFNFITGYSKEKFTELISSISQNEIHKWVGKSNASEYTQNFFDAFMLHQCFLIPDAECRLLANCSVNSFPNRWKKLDFNPYAPILRYARNDNEFDLNMHLNFREVEHKWLETYGDVFNIDIRKYNSLPRRVGLVPDFISTIQCVLLQDASTPEELKTVSNINADDLNRILRMNITDEMLINIHNVFNVPVLTPETFKKYTIRTLTALEHRYRQYMSSENVNHRLCEYIRKSFEGRNAEQVEYDTFLELYTGKWNS